LDSKTEQPSRPKAASPRPSAPKPEFKKPELPSRPKQEAAKPELPSRPKQEAVKPGQPSRPKQEAAKPEQPSRPKQEAVKPEQPSRPKQEAAKPEQPSRPKQEAVKPERPSRPKQEAPKPELPSRPRQESRPNLSAEPPPRPRQESRPNLSAEPPPRPKQESRPNLSAEPPPRPRQESRPRLESLNPTPEEEARARAVAAEAVAKALASTEQRPAGSEAAGEPKPPALGVGGAVVSAVPEPRPISLPPIRPSLPPGRRWAFIGGLAGVLVVSLVVLGWLLSTVSSSPDIAVPSSSVPIASSAPSRATAEQADEEEEEETAAPVPASPATSESPPVPVGSAPGLLEQAVANLNSAAGSDGKSFDRDAAMKALDTAANRASRCRSKGDPSGNVTVLVIFNPSGTVKEAKVVDTRYDGRPTARCIASRMAQARIRPFEGTPKTLAKSVVIP
jgi:hypothetical protein